MPLAQATEATSNLPAGAPVHGFVAAGYEPVAAEFARNFTELGDVGAAFSVVRDGETGGRSVGRRGGTRPALGRGYAAADLLRQQGARPPPAC